MTPHCYVFPIDSIPPVEPLDTDLPCQRQVYQIIVGFINWLATCTRPDIAPALTFLASYRNAPHPQHYNAPVHTLNNITSTNKYCISFHPKSSSTIQAFKHFTHHHDKEAYTETTAPFPPEYDQLAAFYDANWGGKFVIVVKGGTPLEIIKFRSFFDFLICRYGGPIAWKSIR